MVGINLEPATGQTATDVAMLIARYDRRAPRYTSYPTAPHFSPAVGATTYADWLSQLPAEMPLSLYLHVPFCDRLCLYCGCNTSVVRLESSHRAYASLLMREIDHVAQVIGRRAKVTHMHWGGGTPTSLPGDCLIAIMGRLRERFFFTNDAEIAIEIDPTSLPPDRREALGPMGVTRVSFGVQDLEPSVQRAIGRQQSYEETETCAKAARSLGVSSLKLDLIYGLLLQTEEGVAATARRALDLRADRVAVFGYAHVPWMKRHQALIPEDQLPGSVERYAQLNAIHRVLSQEGGVCRHRPRSLCFAERRDGQGVGGGQAQAELPRLHNRRRASADRLRRELDRRAAARLRAERPDGSPLRQGDRGRSSRNGPGYPVDRRRPASQRHHRAHHV
jgi:oxygen-independent coproporphyrinogen-3 oxidase